MGSLLFGFLRTDSTKNVSTQKGKTDQLLMAAMKPVYCIADGFFVKRKSVTDTGMGTL